MLGVNRHERARRPHRGSRSRCPARRIDLRCKRHDQVAADNKALFVRERQDLASLERLVARAQARSTHKRVHDHVNLGQSDQVDHGIHPKAERAVFPKGFRERGKL